MTSPQEDPLLERFGEEEEQETGGYRPGWLTILISLVILLALLATLIAPILQRPARYRVNPTATPSFLKEAGSEPEANPGLSSISINGRKNLFHGQT